MLLTAHEHYSYSGETKECVGSEASLSTTRVAFSYINTQSISLMKLNRGWRGPLRKLLVGFPNDPKQVDQSLAQRFCGSMSLKVCQSHLWPCTWCSTTRNLGWPPLSLLVRQTSRDVSRNAALQRSPSGTRETFWANFSKKLLWLHTVPSRYEIVCFFSFFFFLFSF